MPKTTIERLKEVRALYEQLFSFGLSPDLDGVATFRGLANHFVKTGEGASGKIPLVGFKRNLVYKLSNQSHIDSTIVLQFAEHV